MLNNFSYNYYSGANILIKLFNLFKNEMLFIDCVGISYNVNYGSTPIYSYCSELFDAVLRGREMVQGTLVLNHTSSKLLSEFLNEADADNVGISFLNAAPFAISINFGKDKLNPIIIKECVIISRGQTIQIDSTNILEEYNFVGKEVLQETTEQTFALEDMKKNMKRTPFQKIQTTISETITEPPVENTPPPPPPPPVTPTTAPVPVINLEMNKANNQVVQEFPAFVDNNPDLNKRGISNTPRPIKETAVTETNEAKTVTPESSLGVTNNEATIPVKTETPSVPRIGYQINKVKGRADNKEFDIKSPLDPALLLSSNNKTKTKDFLTKTFANPNEDVNENVKDMLAYMVSKERKGLGNNGREPLVNETELEREQAALLWTATNRMKIKDINYTDLQVDKPTKDEQLLEIFNKSSWASYHQSYANGSYSGAYNNPKNSQIKNTVDRFFAGDLPNEIFTNTNFVHANNNLKTVPSWSLDYNQNTSNGKEGASGYEPVYVGNAIFSYGFNSYYPTLENEYLRLYPEYYDNDQNYMQKRLYVTNFDHLLIGEPESYKYNATRNNSTKEDRREKYNPDEKEEGQE